MTMLNSVLQHRYSPMQFLHQSESSTLCVVRLRQTKKVEFGVSDNEHLLHDDFRAARAERRMPMSIRGNGTTRRTRSAISILSKYR
jgi:hypothetical protein